MKTLIILFAIMILPSLGGVGGGLYAQIVNIPDPIFKALLIMEGVDTNNDGEIQVSEAEAVTGMLDVSIHFPDPIYDLTGIEAFINITGLNVWGNELTTLDLSSNTLLTELDCTHNNLTYLNVENCPNLQNLLAYHNQLTSIDLFQNINLEVVSLYNNQLTSIDLTSNVDLRGVSLQNNQLTHLEIRNGNNVAIEHFRSTNNPNLICIFVDDTEYSENSPVWHKDSTSTYVETEVECDALGIIDLPFDNLIIYPNPVEDILNISIPHNYKNIEVRIVNSKGALSLIDRFVSNNIQLDIHCLKSGIYFIIIEDLQTKETLTKKFVKR